MNATSISPPDFVEAENDLQSDSDTNSDDTHEYYQPISAVDDEDSDLVNSDEEHHHSSYSHNLDNGYCSQEAEEGISSLHINDDGESKGSDEEEEEEEEERMIGASDSAILRAFRDDESRRNAPLTPENAMRVMEAMRGISFGGLAPDWAGRVPENQWIHRLRRLRQQPEPNPSTSLQN